MKHLLFYIVLGMTFSVSAQEKDSVHLIQLSGVVVSSDSLEQMPYATVYDKSMDRGVLADLYGFFSIVVKPGDTIMFRYYGHLESSYIVPDTLTDDRYSMIHMMTKDPKIHTLPEVTIYPWPSREDFARAFIEMDGADDAVRRAQKQLSGESLAFIAARVDTDGSLSYGNAVNQQNTRLYTMGQMPGNNLLNPYAWAEFLQKWRQGELGRQ